MKTPRQYQEAAIGDLIAALMKSKRVMNKAPTGAGKTFMVGEAMRRLLPLSGGCAWFVTNRKHIIEQSKIAFAADFPGVPIYCETVQALSQPWAMREMIKRTGPVSYLIYDEASTCMNNTSFHIYYFLNDMRENPYSNKLKVIGLDATHERADGRPMGLFYEAIGFDIPIATLIEQGYTAKPIFKKLDGRIMDLQYVADMWDRHGRNRKSIIFTRGIENVDRLAAIMRDMGIDASPHHSKLSNRQRNKAVKSKVIISDSTLERGADIRDIGCVMVASNPTSQSRYIQMVGRGLRPDTDDCLIIDIASPHQSLVQTSDVLMDKRKWDWLNGNEENPKLFNVTTSLIGVF